MSLFSEGGLFDGILRFLEWVGLDNKTRHKDNSLKQLTLTVHGFIFGRAYYPKDICVCDLGGFFSGGSIFRGACYRNFTVKYKYL